MPENPYQPPKEVNEPPVVMRDPTQLEEIGRAVGRWIIYRVKVFAVLLLMFAGLMALALWLDW